MPVLIPAVMLIDAASDSLTDSGGIALTTTPYTVVAMLVERDAIFDNTLTTGTGTITVANTPPSGYRTFNDVLTINDGCAIRIRHTTLNEWEDSIAVYVGTHQLSRVQVLASSNSNAAVNFSAGNKEVYLTKLAETMPQIMNFYGSTAPSTVKLGASIDTILTDATPGSEDFDLRFRLMIGGAPIAQVLRISGTNTFLNWPIWPGQARVASDISFTNNTTLADVMTVNVVAGRTYSFLAVIFATYGANGANVAIGGSSTPGNVQYSIEAIDNAGVVSGGALQTAYGGAIPINASNSSAVITIKGTVSISGSGGLTVKFAQRTSGAATSTIKQGSYFIVQDMN